MTMVIIERIKIDKNKEIAKRQIELYEKFMEKVAYKESLKKATNIHFETTTNKNHAIIRCVFES
jgi:hypothetical protein